MFFEISVITRIKIKMINCDKYIIGNDLWCKGKVGSNTILFQHYKK